ncbi:MAG: hypothetical protein ABI811_22480 [Acidobacteriota bacterium]
MCNLFLSMMDRMRAPQRHFGDSTGYLDQVERLIDFVSRTYTESDAARKRQWMVFLESKDTFPLKRLVGLPSSNPGSRRDQRDADQLQNHLQGICGSWGNLPHLAERIGRAAGI